MPIFFKYIWIIFGLFNLAGFFTIPMRVKKLSKSPEEENEVRNFLVIVSLCFTTPFFLIGFIQLLGGFPNGFFVFFAPLDNVFVLAAILVMILLWAIVAYGVFFSDGAKKVIQYQLVHGAMAKSEMVIKFIFGVALLGGLLSITVIRFLLPPLPPNFP